MSIYLKIYIKVMGIYNDEKKSKKYILLISYYNNI